ncbi:beta-defensin 33-like isoform X2 [Cavia porcellus]
MKLLFLFLLLVGLMQTALGYRRSDIFLECAKMGGACKHQKTHGCSILPAECKSRHKHCCRV